jgi:hypothetical protein
VDHDGCTFVAESDRGNGRRRLSAVLRSYA